MSVSFINQQIQGLTVLLDLRLQASGRATSYNLYLALGGSEVSGADAVLIEFLEVGQLCVADLGGGLTQLLGLHVEDVRDNQWDRVSFQVTELERESISFTCKDIRVLSRFRVGEEPIVD